MNGVKETHAAGPQGHGELWDSMAHAQQCSFSHCLCQCMS